MCFVYIYVYVLMYAKCPQKLEESVRTPRTAVIADCVPQWMLGIEPGSFERVASPFNYWTTSPDHSGKNL